MRNDAVSSEIENAHTENITRNEDWQCLIIFSWMRTLNVDQKVCGLIHILVYTEKMRGY
jgi:hypothetical protein